MLKFYLYMLFIQSYLAQVAINENANLMIPFKQSIKFKRKSSKYHGLACTLK